MASSLITTYLGSGLAANRPASPSVPSGGLAWWYSTDTLVLSYYDTSWHTVSGSANTTAPTIVQSVLDNSGIASATFGLAPTNGNLLVAMCSNPSVNTAGTGWTSQTANGSGTDFFNIFTKTAGVGESTTQSPLNASPGGTGLIGIWELNGQNATPYVAGASQAELAAAQNLGVSLPIPPNSIALAMVGLVTGVNISAVYGGVQDQLIASTGNRRGWMGHFGLQGGIAQPIANFSGSGSSKIGVCVITH